MHVRDQICIVNVVLVAIPWVLREAFKALQFGESILSAFIFILPLFRTYNNFDYRTMYSILLIL